ncbi:MAG: hypothetical protein QOI92_2570 [Chloroflexota bacterium]|nr:hypothetical protein [Chloroflexota bacterium]
MGAEANVDDLEAYRWMEPSGMPDAYCVSVAIGAGVADVVAAFACDLGSRCLATFDQQWDLATPYPEGGGNDTVSIDEVPGAVICAELNGWAGVSDERASLLSRRGRYVSVYRNVNAVMQVLFADAGDVVRSFDPLLYDPEGAISEEQGLPFGHPGSPGMAQFVLMERLTGVRLTREWLLDTPHPTYRRDPSV